MPVITGKDAIRTALKPMLDDPNFSLTFQTTTAEASKGGDFVYALGTYAQTFSDPKNPKRTISDKGKYLTLWRKQTDGVWRAVADMINSDLPLTPPSQEKKKASKAGTKSKSTRRKAR
jgi:ketosteroid isomerase-like protein